MTPREVLRKYWGYPRFREVQERIVLSLLEKRDVLGILPTGGGKSICFQVPAMMMEGVCLVITPLVALMEDQVRQLRKKNMEAAAIHSGMGISGADVTLDNCIYGKVKFLYVSPERLETPMFKERLPKMNICLIAVDEAHCISQWGHDFRPAYLGISQVRKVHTGVPVVALTATATQQVQDEVREKLEMKDPQVFQAGFSRPNLTWVVRKSEQKEKHLIDILTKVTGTAIVYVRSRKAVGRVAQQLNSRGISTGSYHAGMEHEARAGQQEDWLTNRNRVMVATNAFGMGIDKPDVRTVVHLDLPEDIESYYQEAGRAGRDGKKAYVVVLYHPSDILGLEQKMADQYPGVAVLKQVYQALGNYCQLAVGGGEGAAFSFDHQVFSTRFNIPARVARAALKMLAMEGLIHLGEAFYQPSNLVFHMDRAGLYAFQIAHSALDPIIKTILRLYGGEVLGQTVAVSESKLARAMDTPVADVVGWLKALHQLQAIQYEAASEQPLLTWLMSRHDTDRLPVDSRRVEKHRALKQNKMKEMIRYVVQDNACRMRAIQHYFGEEVFSNCGHCDVCIDQRKVDGQALLQDYIGQIEVVLSQKPLSREALEQHIAPKVPETLDVALRSMLDDGRIYLDEHWLFRLGSGQSKS